LAARLRPHRIEVGNESARHYKDGSLEFVERHEHLLGVCACATMPHLVLSTARTLAMPARKLAWLSASNQFQHFRFPSPAYALPQ